METRKGRQTPTQSVVLPYSKSLGQDAVDLYNRTGRTAQEWQELLLTDILAVNDDGLWTHTKFGYSVPRRNGKNEIISSRELYGLTVGEKILHTAHRTTTSHSAAMRLAKLLDDLGYIEVQRVKKDEKYDKHYTFSKQFGLEKITIIGKGSCDFRTRTSKGGLGEGFDLLVIDEAQEYLDDQESSLKYVVTDSKNPQTIMCGTPPTAVSSGTIFLKYRENILAAGSETGGWAEWSVEQQSDPSDIELWYETNPSLGTIFTERSVKDELGSDIMDFNIQRLGLWVKENLKSAISKTEWEELQVEELPAMHSKLYVGIKYGNDGNNVAMSIAVKCTDGRVFIECIDCKSTRNGTRWLTNFLINAKSIDKVIIDGTNGQQMMADRMKENHLKKPVLPTVKEIITANSMFEEAVFQKKLCHKGQPSLTQVVSNCEHRTIGTNGGFGYKSLFPDFEIALMDSCILAYWLAQQSKEKKKQRAIY